MSTLESESLFDDTSNKETGSGQARKWQYWITGVGLSCAYLVLRGSSWHSSAELHTLLEALATMLAFVVGCLAMVRFYTKKDSTILFVGVAFLGTAFLDGYHTVVTSAYFKPLFPSTLDSLIPWSWIASRLYLAIVLYLSWWTWRYQVTIGVSGRINERHLYAAAASLTLGSFLFFAFLPLPRAYYPELFFHRPEEFVPALFFLLALVGYLRKGLWKESAFEHWLVLALIVNFVGQAVFMCFSGGLFDMEFDVAHLLKKVSYVFVLIGLLNSVYSAFQQVAGRKVVEEMNRRLQREVNDRQRIQTQLVTREKELVRSNEELEKFAYISSHDLQEPLRKVQAFGHLLSSEYGDVLDDQGKDYLARMQNAGRRMSCLINDLLEFSRVSSMKNELRPTDLNEVLNGVISDLEVRIQESQAVIELDPLPVIDADSLQMRQLFQNLISNSLKYQPQDNQPHIRITSEIVQDHLGLEGLDGNDGAITRIRVIDNGIGFESRHAEKIFEVFQRLHNRDEHSGSGIGLSICRKITERHGGTLTASAEPCSGACFTLTLKNAHPKLQA